jgi:hypothetical protein
VVEALYCEPKGIGVFEMIDSMAEQS